MYLQVFDGARQHTLHSFDLFHSDSLRIRALHKYVDIQPLQLDIRSHLIRSVLT